MKLKSVLAQCAIAASLGVAAPAVMANPSQPVAAEHTALVSTPAQTEASPTTRDDAAQYAQREQQQPKAAQFRGGDTVVIAMSSGAVIVAIILLVLLL